MSRSTYCALPIEGLYKLLEATVKDMIAAYDSNPVNMIAFIALKKQVEILLDIIEEKRLEPATIS
jgi:hypothetical protein